MSIDISVTDQQLLWDQQHAVRGGINGQEGDHLADIPNASAVMFIDQLSANSVIAEIGSANGRDARYWATLGHQVLCMDFSAIALGQLNAHAIRQGISSQLDTFHFDANDGVLPESIPAIDGFYARSALHIDDDALFGILEGVHERLSDGGVVLIEGKSTLDPKIARSTPIGNGLAVDHEENGHVRRIWTTETLDRICTTFGWTALDVSASDERWETTDASFLRLVAKK